MDDDLHHVRFGTVEVGSADIVAHGTSLHISAFSGVMNKHEVGMLILFLKDKQEKMKAVGESQ